MPDRIPRSLTVMLVFVLAGAFAATAEPGPQNAQPVDPNQSVDGRGQDPKPAADPAQPTVETSPLLVNELPDAPTPAQPVGQNAQTTNPQQPPTPPATAPSGAAAAKAPAVRGAPASRPIGAAIAPAKPHQHRSLLIKAGLVAGACVAVGSVFALSKGSPSKPPGAP